jgi:hypothetical protein
MKKNDWALVLSVFAYSWLFYQQAPGLNFLVFNCIVVFLLAWRERGLLKDPTWISVSSGAILSSFFIFMYSSPLAIVANIFSLAILSALSIDRRTSFLTGIFLTLCSAGSSCVFMFIDWVERKKKQVAEVYKRPFYVKLFLVLIPLLIALVFFLFYQSSSPLFYDLTKDINLDFISIGWILFTFGGLLLMYGFFNNNKMTGLVDADKNAALNLTPGIAGRSNFLNKLMRLDTENMSGLILFSLLNLLLLTVNVLDLNYLWFDGKLPEGIKHKEFVHDGIGTLITSVIVAILILLYYFRGQLNFYEKSKAIRCMAYAWILQNAFMIFSTAYRNNMYIQESGLSYKKIGVYVYLGLTLVGLATTFIKVWKLKTNWYLFRVNAAICFYILVVSCIPNWDVIITRYNIAKYAEEKKDLEKYLLLDLSFKNLPELLSLPDQLASMDDLKARDYYYQLRGVYFIDYKSGLSTKLFSFMEQMQNSDWQSICAEKERVYKEVFAMKDHITELRLLNLGGHSLLPMAPFANLRKLNVSNSYGLKVGELKVFPRLESLDLTSCQLDTLDELPVFAGLKELDLSGNNLRDISRLRDLKKLEVLDLSGYNVITDYSPLFALRNLRKLSIGNISQTGMDSLKHAFPRAEISATIIDGNR